MELAGTHSGEEYDQLLSDGTISLDGTLDVVLIEGFGLANADAFDLFDGDTNGAFHEVVLPDLAGGLRWDTSDLYDGASIGVTPEPTTLGFLAAGGLGLALRRRT